jgi:hypothetical protein
MTAAEKRATAALADVLIPSDEFGPAASAVGVVDFLDEWISAPYEPQQRDAKVIREGLAWLDAESERRAGKVFADATALVRASTRQDVFLLGVLTVSST